MPLLRTQEPFFRALTNPSHPHLIVQTDEGKDAVRILYYKARTPPHQASLEQDWTKIQAATLNEKKDKILQKWFQKARADVFINIDPEYDNCGILDERQ